MAPQQPERRSTQLAPAPLVPVWRALATLLVLTACAAAPSATAQDESGSNPYHPPLYWSVYEYHIVRQQADSGESSIGETDTSANYIPESELLANIDWVETNLAPLGYNMVVIDGWGDTQRLSENGYRSSHSQYWEHDYAWWSAHLRARGMRFGMYENPMFVHVQPDDIETMIVGTNIPVSSLIDPDEDAFFTWVQVDRPGAEQYLKGYVAYYADMGIDYLRIDFLAWFEDGHDRYLGRVGPERPREHYETALRWIREAADEHGVYLSFAMPHLKNEAELERQYAHGFRINEDVDYGEWWKFSQKDRGHRFDEWSQYANAFDGFTYWSYLSGRNLVRADGDFIRMNTFATDTEARTVISTHLMAGGPVAVADRHDTIGDRLWVYQNESILALNYDAFVGKPLSNDPTNEASQIWTGQMSNGEWIVGLFNRESTPRTRALSFADLGLSGEVAALDLWQHAPLGAMSEISVELPPHGSMMLRLTVGTVDCEPQTITFDSIADIVYGGAPATLSATSTSGLPVDFEVALGPATADGNVAAPTGQSGIVYVVAAQSGDAAFCAAMPVVGSFAVTGGHQAGMWLAGTFTEWTAVAMQFHGEQWVAEEVPIPAGEHELKFANTTDFTGEDWGNAVGLSGVALSTTGGGPNIGISVPEDGFYRVTFNDLTLEYEFVPVDPGTY